MSNSKSKSVRVLNIDIDNLTTQELLERFNEGLLVTPNIDHLMRLQKNKALYDAYHEANFKVCDSRIIFLLIKFLFPQSALKEQITGSDFFPAFCKYHAENNLSAKVFLLGGTEQSVGVAENNINQKSGARIIVGGYSPPFGFEHSEAETTKIAQMITDSGADTLAIGVGSPKQELWVVNNRKSLPSVKRFLAIGATIEFESGNLKRSPKWMTQMGLEWLYRLSQEPGRLAKRYLVEDLPFFVVILKQRLGFYKNPWSSQ